jgi:hypothetical protein
VEFIVTSRRVLSGSLADLPYFARLAWEAVRFEAERLRGRVKLPVRDLAGWATITKEEAAEALRLFQAPDPYSSSKEEGGRRLIPVAGEDDWYIVVTWGKHAAEREIYFNRLRQQRFKAKNRDAKVSLVERYQVMHSNDPVTKEPEPELKEESNTESEPFVERASHATKESSLFGSDAEVLAKQLFDRIAGRHPTMKPPDLAKWAREVDLMIRSDHRKPAEIAEVIDWCQDDVAFWQNNILSTKKLRAQYDQLVLKMRQTRNPTARKYDRKPMAGSEQFADKEGR